MNDSEIVKHVKDYYGEELKSSSDLMTSVCQINTNLPTDILEATKHVPDEIKSTYYGCGIIYPEFIDGSKIVDIGCGTGKDCYVLSQFVGSNGTVIGIDMIEKQVSIANKYVDEFRRSVGICGRLVFVKGYIERLSEYVTDRDVDIIVSNCVVNLAEDKRKVLREAYEVLKTGGEIYFSDIYSDKYVSQKMKENKLLWGECISGALYWKELYELAKDIGFSTPRLVQATKVELSDELSNDLEGINFVSATYRLFKVTGNQKQSIEMKYIGEKELKIDLFNTFKPNEVRTVDGELFAFLNSCRYKQFFQNLGASSDEMLVDMINPFDKIEKKKISCCSNSKKCC